MNSPQVKAWMAKYNAAKKEADGLRPAVRAAERSHEALLERSDKAAMERGVTGQTTTAMVMTELREAKGRYAEARERTLRRLATSNKLYAESKSEYASAQAELKKGRGAGEDVKELAELARTLTELNILINQVETEALQNDATYNHAKRQLDVIQSDINDLRRGQASSGGGNPYQSQILASKRNLETKQKPYFAAMRKMEHAKLQAEGVYRKLATQHQMAASATRLQTNNARFQQRQQQMRQRMQQLRNQRNGSHRGRGKPSMQRRKR